MAVGLSLFVIISCCFWQLIRAPPPVPSGNLAPGYKTGTFGQGSIVWGKTPNLQYIYGQVPSSQPSSPFSLEDLARWPGDKAVILPPEVVPDVKRGFVAYSQLLNDFKGGAIPTFSNDIPTYHWTTSIEAYRELNPQKRTWVKEWLVQKGHIKKNDLQTVSDIDWSLERSASDQPAWWSHEDITGWKRSKLDWKRMIQIGDLLQFQEVTNDYKLRPEHLKKINRQFGSILRPVVTDKDSKIQLELQSLRSFKDNGKKTMLDERIRQVIKGNKYRLQNPDVQGEESINLKELVQLLGNLDLKNKLKGIQT